MTRRVVVITPRMLTKDQAAQYCGVSAEVFFRICPVRPAAIGNSIRSLRYDVKLLDAWLDNFGPDTPETLHELWVDELLAKLDGPSPPKRRRRGDSQLNT
ncbi:hypothetical protein [Beijerinckia sp. L45]|uniref:hypothetical protein n=1 Tax=Beijerinckia sp. L45 TaxID=1641855 RepID=UPI00131DF150|nr:hypothetical protein [Beijerinckia sp. L45]